MHKNIYQIIPSAFPQEPVLCFHRGLNVAESRQAGLWEDLISGEHTLIRSNGELGGGEGGVSSGPGLGSCQF